MVATSAAPGINSNDSAYATHAGTSMATPHVSGAATLLLGLYPNATLAELRRRILDGVVQIPTLANKTTTGGRLNVYNSLVAAPKGTLELEASPRPGQPIPGGTNATLYAIVSDVQPVTNATVTAAIAGFTNLTLLDGGTAPDALARDGVYTVSFLVPTNLPSLQVTFHVSAPGWPDATNFITYPVVLPPPNDNFASRIAISTNLCQMTVTGSNFNGSTETGEPLQPGQIAGHSVWWSWTAPFSGPVKVSTMGSSFDTLLGVKLFQEATNRWETFTPTNTTKPCMTITNKVNIHFSSGEFGGESYPALHITGNNDDNTIGLRFLARHLVTFNFPRRTMYLKRVSVGALAQ